MGRTSGLTGDDVYAILHNKVGSGDGSGASGQDGVGISSIVKTGTEGLVDTYTITLTNNSTYTFTVTNGEDGAPGATGATPNIQIGTVQTLDSDSGATASITGTAENPLLNLGIPKGEKGDSGESNVDEEKIQEAVEDYLTENPIQEVTIDSTLTQSGQAADAETTGYELSKKEDVSNKVIEISDGVTDTQYPSALAVKSYIDSILSGNNSGDLILEGDIPTYVKSEALEVAQKVNAAQNDNTITFFVMSDSHHCASQTDGWKEQTNESNLHAMMGAKTLMYNIDADFAVFNGDFVFGNASTTTDQLKEQVSEIKEWFEEVFRSIPRFYTVGNHDTGEYNELVGAEYCMSEIMGASSATEFGGTSIGNPYYYDLTGKKIRIICLNTCENEMTNTVSASTTSTEQIEWFANTLKGVGGKSDGSEWGIIVIGHYPLDFGGARFLSDVVYHYMQGDTYEYSTVSVDFSDSNKATFIGNFHGHTHCLKSDNMYYYDAGTTPTAYDAYRLATPASSFYRNNEYTTEVNGVMFGEDSTYSKTAETGEDTAFLVNVIDLSKQVIQSFCYGAGYDRTVSYGETKYYSVNYEMSNVSVSNSVSSVKEGESYITEVIVSEDCTLDSISVTMGGSDVTASVVSGTTITIESVTGDVVIKATATVQIAIVNMIPLSTTSVGGSELYNGGQGYKTDTRVNSSSIEVAMTGMCCTGFMNVSSEAEHTVRIKNVTIEGTGSAYLLGMSDDETTVQSWTNANLTADESGVITVTSSNSSIKAFRLSCGVIDSTSIITIDQEIE